MNKDIIQGNWKEVKGKLQKKWGEISENDIQTMKGSYQELEGALQKNYGYQKDQADREIESFIDENDWH